MYDEVPYGVDEGTGFFSHRLTYAGGRFFVPAHIRLFCQSADSLKGVVGQGLVVLSVQYGKMLAIVPRSAVKCAWCRHVSPKVFMVSLGIA